MSQLRVFYVILFAPKTGAYFSGSCMLNTGRTAIGARIVATF